MTAIRLRPEVLCFAQDMERKLRRNANKTPWREHTLGYILQRLKEEVEELQEELEWKNKGCCSFIEVEAVDVGNFAMMLHDVAGRIT